MCFERQAWREAYELLSAADRASPLEPADLERLATAAYLIGRELDSADIWVRAHHEFRNRGNPERAAWCAFRLAFDLFNVGETARGSGWLARARRLLEEHGRDSVVLGYLLIQEGVRVVVAGDPASGYARFCEAADIARRFGDTDLIAIARQGQGRTLIKMGKHADGIALLDEVMIAVTADELSPIIVGDIYCSVIEACYEIFDLGRAQEWTAALSRWCERQPDQLPYRGSCLIRRAQIMQMHGAWEDALDEARRACERLSLPPPKPAVGSAHYQCGELNRLRGEFAKAEEAYRRASECGRKPQPGLALMRLAQGDVAAALASIRRVVDETRGPSARSRVLGAYVEVLLAAVDVAAARAAADELREIATSFDAPLLRAAAAHSCAAVLIAEGDAEGALSELRDAETLWRELDAPYDEARSRVLVAVASRAIGDDDTSALELDAARRVFERLGAVTDVARVGELARAGTSKGKRQGPGQLTAREREVLALVATGKTNRAIAGTLRLSEKTIARHVSNIFLKLGLSTRAAATAYAYRNRLV